MQNISQQAKAPIARFAQAATARRDALLTAAAVLFTDRGYLDVTIADITDKAGISVGCFYLSFRSKEAMYIEGVRDGRLPNGLRVRAAGPDSALKMEVSL